MANIVQLLDILKWNTDEKHPLTQENLRKIPGANECMGYKSTFKNQLHLLANTYNTNQNESKWRIVFPGYKIKKTNPAQYYTGPIFYRHEINSEELYFIIKQIHGIPFEQKARLILQLIKATGSKYSPTTNNNILETIDFSNLENFDFTNPQTVKELEKLIQTHEFPTYVSQNLYHNINIIGDAINREKLLSFSLSYINRNGELISLSDKYMVSPYRIIFHKGYYWLIGNQRLGTYLKEGWNYNKYSDTLDLFRIDKLTNLTIAKNCYELRAKIGFVTNPRFYRSLHLITSKIHVYKENIKIKATDITDTYGIIEFEILWNNFSHSTVRDYSFIFDSFGNNFSVRHENETTIVCVQANEECFIDWALMNIDKIKILDGHHSEIIKKKIKDKIKEGLKHL